MKSPRSKPKAILAVLYVVTKCVLHSGNKMDRPHVGECSLDAAAFSKIYEHSYTPRYVLAPALTRRFRLLTDAMLL